MYRFNLEYTAKCGKTCPTIAKSNFKMSAPEMNHKEKEYQFTFILDYPGEINAELEDVLYEAGCDDAILYQQNGILHIGFTRTAYSLEHAVSSAMEAIVSVSVPVEMAGVEPGDIVTAAEISRRLGISREYVRLLVKGERGPGKFPLPIARPTPKMHLWSWREVAHFAQQHLPEKHNYQILYEQAKYMHQVNQQLREAREGY
jgi:hypothetical protein